MMSPNYTALGEDIAVCYVQLFPPSDGYMLYIRLVPLLLQRRSWFIGRGNRRKDVTYDLPLA